MKKRFIVFLIIILVIIGVIFGIRKINNSKINYRIEEVNKYNYAKLYENEKYGVIDLEGNIIISPEYKDIVIINPEKDIFVCYEDDNNIKILNSKEEELFSGYENIQPIKLKNVASILCYEKTVLTYQKDGLYGLVDINGKKITKNIYDSIENLKGTEGKLLVSKNGKYGVININGKKLVDTKYDNIKTDEYYTENEKYLKAGFIVSNTTDDGFKIGYIDYTGKKILDAKYNDIMRATSLDDLYLIVSENGKYGFFEKSKKVIPFEYQSISYDESGLLLLEKNKKYGMSDLKGEIKIKVTYDDIEYKGIYVYANNSNESIVYDTNGDKQDINFNKTIYKTDNENYRISTMMNNNILYYGIENKEGIKLVNEVYSYIEYIFKDYFIAKNQKGKMGIINANGKTILDFKYQLIQKFKGKNLLQVLDTKNNTHIYNEKIEDVYKMKNAKFENNDNYIKLYNDKETKYLDNNGNEISEDNEMIKNENIKGLPNEIDNYTKVQYSLDNAYYIKK